MNIKTLLLVIATPLFIGCANKNVSIENKNTFTESSKIQNKEELKRIEEERKLAASREKQAFESTYLYKESLQCKEFVKNLNDKQFIQFSEELIKYGMKDPESTNFRNGRIVESAGFSRSYCVEVNSKNSYGGYGGFEQYIVMCPNLGTLDDKSKGNLPKSTNGECIREKLLQ